MQVAKVSTTEANLFMQLRKLSVKHSSRRTFISQAPQAASLKHDPQREGRDKARQLIFLPQKEMTKILFLE